MLEVSRVELIVFFPILFATVRVENEAHVAEFRDRLKSPDEEVSAEIGDEQNFHFGLPIAPSGTMLKPPQVVDYGKRQILQ